MTTFDSTIPFKGMEGKEGLDALFLYATEGILIVNDQGIIVKINPSAERLFRYEKDELAGKKIEDLIPRRYASMHEKHRGQYHTHPHPRAMGAGMDLFGLRKDGTEFPVEISLSPYKGAAGNYVIAFIIDITARKEAENHLKNYSIELEQQVKNRTLILEEAIEELEKTKAELNEALSKEKDLNELKSRFVSMASHEFRTPLAAIQSSLSLVKKYGELNDKEKQEKHIVRIKSTISNLTDILNDFLSISRLEEGKTECVMETFDLTEFISALIADMQELAGEKPQIVYQHTGNSSVVLDKKLLKNILINLISNAIKFSPEGDEIRVTTVRKADELVLTVADQGMGIPEEDKQHLFERFFRGTNAVHIQGTGLGLNIVARYTELMHGNIKVETEENRGTTFTLIFRQ